MGKTANLTQNDVVRRNRITQLLVDWGLVDLVEEDQKLDIKHHSIKLKFYPW